MEDYRSAVLCNINNDRRLNLRGQVAPRANDDEEVAMKDGPLVPPPDEYVIAPDAAEWPESQQPRPCARSDASLNPEASGDSLPVPNTQTPKRARTTKKDEEFTRRHSEISREVATTLEKAIPLDPGEVIDHAMIIRLQFSEITIILCYFVSVR